jgi:O-antigen/teichoic acid export membrane protein
MFVRDSINTFLIRCAIYVLAFAISIVISNLGQEVKGQVAVVIFVSGLVQIISTMGYDVAIVFFLRQGKYDYDTIARNLNALIPIIIPVWTLLLFPLMYYLHGIGLFGEIDFILIAACFVICPASALMNIQMGILIGSGEIPGANKIGLVFNALYLLFVLAATFFMFADTWAVIAAYAAALLAAGLLGVAMNLGRGRSRRGFEWDKTVIKDLGSWGIRSQAGALARRMTNRVDLFLTNFYSTAFLAGVYSVALNWAELPQFIPVMLVYVLFPHASGREKAASIDLTNRITRISLLTLLVMSVVICIAFPFMEKLIYKPDYSEAMFPLMIVLPGLVLKGLFRVLMGGLDGLGKPQYSTIASYVALASTVALNIILIPRFGMIGAAASTSVTGAVAFFVMAHFYRKVSEANWSDFLIVHRADVAQVFDSLKNELLRRRNG